MGTPLAEYVEVVTRSGGWLDAEGRLHYPRALVERGIKMSAKEWIWHGFDDDNSIHVGGEPGALRYRRGGRAHPRLRDQPVSPFDHPGRLRLRPPRDLLRPHPLLRANLRGPHLTDPRDLDLSHRLRGADRHVQALRSAWFDPGRVAESAEMFDMALGEPGRVRQRPFVVAYNSLRRPAAALAEESNECLVAQVAAGMPILLISAGQAGATSPAALAGALAQGPGRVSGRAVHRQPDAARPPLRGGTLALRLRSAHRRHERRFRGGGRPERGAAQLLNWLGLPSGVPASMTDSKMPDAQSGYEKGLTVGLAANAGANLIFESSGMPGQPAGLLARAVGHRQRHDGGGQPHPSAASRWMRAHCRPT